MPVTVTTKKTLRKKITPARLGADRGLMLAGMLVAQRATRLAPIDTGRLKRSITHGRPFSTMRGRAINIGTNVKYARIQEFGGRIPPRAVIRPRIKQALAFKVGGEQVVVKAVYDWPGATIPAQPYLRPALLKSRNQVGQIVTGSVTVAMNRKS